MARSGSLPDARSSITSYLIFDVRFGVPCSWIVCRTSFAEAFGPAQSRRYLGLAALIAGVIEARPGQPLGQERLSGDAAGLVVIVSVAGSRNRAPS